MDPSVADIKSNDVENVASGLSKLAVNDSEDKVRSLQPGTIRVKKFPPTEVVEFSYPGLRADPNKPNLLTRDVKLKHLSPYLGTEVTGVQISQLSKEGLDELALFAAERKVLLFRDQDFKDLGPERQIEIAKHFGPIQRHPISPNVKGYPEFYVVYRDTEHDIFKEYISGGHDSSLLIQIRTGHLPLNDYLHKRKLADTDLCEKCNTMRRETIDHFVKECPAYAVQRTKMEKALGRSKRNMRLILTKARNIKILIKYIRATGRLKAKTREEIQEMWRQQQQPQRQRRDRTTA